jgi:hypothetical protein
MTQRQDIAAMIGAVDYIVENGIPGAVVECGTWKGGLLMAAGYRLQELGDTQRELWGFDTFAGMTPAGEHDTDALAAREAGNHAVDEAEVMRNIRETGHTEVELVKCDLSNINTVGRIPIQIAILRLDVDFYAPTEGALRLLYPWVSPGGVVIVDDYGYWQGCRKACDEFFGQPQGFACGGFGKAYLK